MQSVKIYIKYDQLGKGFIPTEILARIQQWLGSGFGGIENIAISSDEKMPDYIDGIVKVEIPVVIKNISRGQVTTQGLEKILNGLLDGYEQYSNLKIVITE